MSYFAVALLSDSRRWTLTELDLDDCESVDDVAELLLDFDQPVRLLALEQDDYYAVLARVEPDATLRVFLSNGHAADDYPLAQLFVDGLVEIGGDPLADDEDAPEGVHDAAPFGDSEIVADLGLKGPELIELAVHESVLPADLIETLCERLGCLAELEAVRG